MRPHALTLALPLLAAMGHSAHAQGSSSEDLFREGVSLFERGETAAACERFERSYKLDAAPGTLFNLANCHERQGRLWQAHLDFADLAERATAAGKLDKAALARQRLAAVDAKLPRLSFVFPGGSNIDTLVVDDVALPHPSWSSPVAVDIGSHTLEFRSPGFVSAKASILARDPVVVRVDVPVLTLQTTGAPPPALPVVATNRPPVLPSAEPQHTVVTEPASAGVNVQAIVGYSVGVVGLAGLGVGAYFVSQAVSNHNEGNTACMSTGSGCASSADTMNAEHFSSLSQTDTVAAAVAFGVGLVGIVAGVTLVATSHKAATPSSSLHVVPMVASHFSGLSMSGQF